MKFRWLLALMIIVVSITAGGGLSKLTFDGNYRVFFGENNPDLIAFGEFQNVYTRNDNLFFLLYDEKAPGFSRSLAEASEALTEKAWTIPFASRVDSITNYQHTYADGTDSLVVENLFRDTENMSDAEIRSRAKIALREPTLVNNVISEDGRAVLVSVTLPFPELNPSEIPQAVAAARSLVDEIEAQYPSLQVALSGTTMFNNAFNEAGQTDSETLIPLTYAVMLLLVLVLLRSFSGTVATLLVIGLSTVTALGLAGWVGIKLMPIAIAAPTIILTLAVADSVHLIWAVKRNLANCLPKREAITAALKSNLAAISLTSITTAIGFLSLNFSDSPPFRTLGTLTAIGVIAAWLYSLVLVPALLMLMPLKPATQAKTGWLERWLSAYSGFVARRPKQIFVIGGLITLGFGALATLNQNNDRFAEYFGHEMEFRHDLELGIDVLKSADIFEVSVSSGEPEGINNPEYLTQLDAFAKWARQQPHVRHVYAYSDVAKRLNMNMHGDDANFRKLPDSSELAAQYLLLYELSLPYGLDLNDRIAVDKSATRVSLSMNDPTAQDLRKLSEDIQAWFSKTNAHDLEPARPTGPSVMFSYISKRNVDAMFSGTLLAVVLVGMSIMIGLRSVKFGLLSLVPNLVPPIIAFGLWGLLVGKIGMAASVIGATSLGIVVDDTIHFIAKYLQGRRENGLPPEAAIAFAFTRVGGAMATTTLIVAVGFAVLATSVFAVNSQLGLLTAITIIIALIFDFTVLPAMLLIGAKRETHIQEG
ncbi:efflux RND transporter permease subunit [Parasphingorhabdus cellanae]|uniref:MMPL family transporter n=1 Tax=Parasphingorhabdus cellanae TaxID=2806553 RepID=A0ABX7T6U4_9SPHN|nr:efflux RND transporter permease subunit [Parasphingorhabdus cellanae]QTD57324.1 MMPL family transporter [Parasphingorhabdus cellanae]